MIITFIQTGGTIDKDYPQGEDNHGYEFKIEEPAFRSILGRVKPCFEVDVFLLLKKDSLDITEEDRDLILQSVQNIQNDKIVITHGTDTIHQTAEKLSVIKGKTIVLTGAMLPEKFRDSDAMFNLGMAVGAVQILEEGVYIALYGIVVPWYIFEKR